MSMRKRLCAAGLAAVILVAGTVGCGEKKVVKTDPRMPVQAVEAKTGSIERIVDYSGVVKGKNEVTLYPKVAARVIAINKHEGERISKGQAIISLDTTDYASRVVTAEAALVQAEANDLNAQRNLERTKELAQQGAASSQSLEQAQMAADVSNATLASGRAALQDARNTLANCKITAPIDGVVGLINVTEGNMVSTQTAAAVVSDMRSVKVDVNVSESEITYVQKGSKVSVLIDSLNGKSVLGTVTSVASVADAASRAFPVEITLNNADGLLKSGMFAEVKLGTEAKNGVIVIPRTAVSEKGARRIVYVVANEKKKTIAREREIEMGIESKGSVEIAKGLKAGERVVVKGQTLLHDGDQVRVFTEDK